ncbi:phospholipase D-like domain-containing protein [Bradyrhizobium centrosematis]|uniref:phospholipase D-like domain-containing protein n=1 Tax=Bradyrhizobium centrosematis TaxID=1300039 RepID=UPI00388DC1E0
MGQITRAVAYCNNEVAFIAWELDGMISGCLGFDIVRVYLQTGERRGLSTWVPFEGQHNHGWKEQDTGVWPVQKTNWRDLTLRRRRDRAERRPDNVNVRYEIRPVGRMAAGLEPVPVRQSKTYDGPVIPLGYLGPAVETNPILVTSDFGDVKAAFNNGIIAGQWLRHAIEEQNKAFNKDVLIAEVEDVHSEIRQYLAGDLITFLKSMIDRALADGGQVLLALYELEDSELIDMLIRNKSLLKVILSNSSAGRESGAWDERNAPARAKLRSNGVDIQNRLFNNRHIGHNKFAVYLDRQGTPRAVMTGSTNWTSLGLCGQTNNSIIIENDDIAAGYHAYWDALHKDVIEDPDPESAPGHKNVQGPDLREADATPVPAALQASRAKLWFSPNTKGTTRNIKKAPPDLDELFALMSGAKQAIFFLAFLPSRGGLYSIIETARQAGETKPELLVVGAISDPTAMPGYQAKSPEDGEEDDETPEEAAARKPYVYDERHTHIVRASNLGAGTAMGDFEAEILKLGTAIVHDKIVVIDPLSDDCVIVTGSHNLGYKASYENDENLLILRGDKRLAQAYAVHILDVYDHYRYRAWQAKNKLEGKPIFSGQLDLNDHWLKNYVEGTKGDITGYFLS